MRTGFKIYKMTQSLTQAPRGCNTYRQDLWWPFVVLIGWSWADVVIVEQPGVGQ